MSPFAEIEIEIADRDYGLALVSFQTNKNIFFQYQLVYSLTSSFLFINIALDWCTSPGK